MLPTLNYNKWIRTSVELKHIKKTMEIMQNKIFMNTNQRTYKANKLLFFIRIHENANVVF
ncbi:MAG: hypothetical protein CMI18_02390 [Opitutaceae bacterium]|nr:hypothetical protein [Opitutaceae bacterium]